VLSKHCVAILITLLSGIVHNHVSDISQTLLFSKFFYSPTDAQVFITSERFMMYLSILSLNTVTILLAV
jgi:hypothetical protein